MSIEGQHADTLFESVANAFYSHFQTFKTSTLITNVIGTGPVPSSAGGPVTGGTVTPAPGNFT
jgi:hypothetical protein